MAVLSDFRCHSCGHLFEEWVNVHEVQAPLGCPSCNSVTTSRQLSAPHLDYTGMVASGVGSSDAMTTSIDRWQKGREQKMAIEKRNMERHGTPD